MRHFIFGFDSKNPQRCAEELRRQGINAVVVGDIDQRTVDLHEDDVFEISGDMCTGALEALEKANGVIIDHVITSERIYCQLREMLGQYPIRTVHVTCPLEVLLQREFARKNRCLGSAEASYLYLYPREGYDLTVDTSVMTTAECAEKILAELL